MRKYITNQLVAISIRVGIILELFYWQESQFLPLEGKK